MNKKFKYIGKSIPTFDAEEKVTGKISYTGDLKFDGMLHAKLILSTIVHGKVKKLETSAAEGIDESVKIFSYKDTPQNLFNAHIFLAEMQDIKDQKIFTDHVKFHGDMIGAIVAKDSYTAKLAAKKVKVQYEELPTELDPEKIISENKKEYIAFSKELSFGNLDNAFKKAYKIIEDKIYTPKQHHAAMEPHLCIAVPNESNDGITIYTPCQVVFQVQLVIAEALSIDLNKVRVIKTKMGGSFGGKGQPVLEPAAAFLAIKTGKPIKLEMDRTESIIGTRTRNAVIGTIKTAVTKDGKILARQADLITDTGAYYTNATAVIMAMAKKYYRLYNIESQSYKGTSVLTNTPVGGACRGYGSPQIHAITEINIENTARRIGMDPVELRLKNLLKPFEEIPLPGPSIGDARAIDCLKRGAELFEWNKKYNSSKPTGRFLTGYGLACSTHGNGYHGAYPDFITMKLSLTAEGKLYLNSAIHDLGCGTVTSMQQIVAEVFDIHPYEVIAIEGDTGINHYDSAGTQASRVTYVCGNCAKLTADKLKDIIIKASSEIFKVPVNKISFTDGNILVENRAISFSDFYKLYFEKHSTPPEALYKYDSKSNPAVYSVNFAEVEVDTFTGLVKVKEIVAVHDVGQAINTGFVEGQIHGGIHMGLGYALSEEIEIDKHGIVKSLNFSRYHIFNAQDMPTIKIDLIEKGENHGPYGAKSVGEIAAVASAPAVINAVNDALGTNITTYPATPERIIKAINNPESD